MTPSAVRTAWVSTVEGRRRRTRALAHLVARLRAEDGPPDAADYAWAEEALAPTPVEGA